MNPSAAKLAAKRKELNNANKSDDESTATLDAHLHAHKATQEIIASAASAQMAHRRDTTTKVEVVNQPDFPTSINTPDVNKVVAAVNALARKVETTEPDNTDLLSALGGIKNQLSSLKIPDPLDKVEITNLTELDDKLSTLITLFEKLELSPQITVSSPDVQVPAVDLAPLDASLASLGERLSVELKSDPVDMSPIAMMLDSVVIAQEATKSAIESIRFPVPNFVQDPLVRYKIADQFDDGVATTIKYYGFISPESNWYIMKQDPSTNPTTYRYASGTKDYATNWAGRASLPYDYLSTVF